MSTRCGVTPAFAQLRGRVSAALLRAVETSHARLVCSLPGEGL